MIAPQELRLGNWININGSHFQVELPDLNLIANKDGKSTYEPIELNEYWLLKFGFDLLHKGKFRNVYDYLLDHRFGYSDNHGLVHVDSALTFVGNSFSHIKYVHQLQNLYFAITGEELKIKES